MGFQLLELPHDVLLAVLNHPSLGPTELCRLERCSRAFRKLVDDSIWKEAFLLARRCNVLREPENWKQEFARRSALSKGWRQLASGTMPTLQPRMLICGQSSAPQKLRRFALKMMVGTHIMFSSKAETHIVDPSSSDPGVFHTISGAIMCCKPYDVVLVRPGRYVERLRLDKPIELKGSESGGSSVLIGVDGPAIEVYARTLVRVANMTIEQHPREGTSAMSGAVLVKGGATLLLEECCISSESGHCVVIQGLDSCGYVLHNFISDGKGVGVLVCDHGKGVIEDNEICFNGRAGIAVLNGADPHVLSNKIHSGRDSGVLISERGKGRIEENDIYNNRRAGVAILKEGAPLVKRNKIHHGRDSGVLVCENGHGCVCDNEIFSNHMAGVAIGRGGASKVTGNTISDGNGGSLCLSLHSRGFISSNVIHQDPSTDMQVPDALLSQVREKNTICFVPNKDDTADALSSAAKPMDVSE